MLEYSEMLRKNHRFLFRAFGFTTVIPFTISEAETGRFQKIHRSPRPDNKNRPLAPFLARTACQRPTLQFSARSDDKISNLKFSIGGRKYNPPPSACKHMGIRHQIRDFSLYSEYSLSMNRITGLVW